MCFRFQAVVQSNLICLCVHSLVPGLGKKTSLLISQREKMERQVFFGGTVPCTICCIKAKCFVLTICLSGTCCPYSGPRVQCSVRIASLLTLKCHCR